VAEFEVSNLVISPPEVAVGETVTIACTVTNIGGEAGSHTVYLGGDFAAQQIVTLQPGESRVVSFEVTPTMAKTYQVSVDGLSGSFVATEIGVPAYSVALGVLNMTPKVDEYVEWWVDITNIGTAPGAPTIKWYKDGSYSYSDVSPSIEPSASFRFSAGSFSFATPGVHTLGVEVDGVYDEITITVAIEAKWADINLAVLDANTKAHLSGVRVRIDHENTAWAQNLKFSSPQSYDGELCGFTAGTITITAEKEGYVSFSQSYSLKEGANNITVEMVTAAPPFDPWSYDFNGDGYIDDETTLREIDETSFSRHLYTSGIPDIDLLIRTGGELRLSNFLIWQTAYSEYYFTPVLWPDFDEKEVDKALLSYSQRQRRFGGD
ncbi:unnamed protein product, partial [marine sediment metagenome]